MSDGDLFDRPARWRADVVVDLGLEGDEHIAGLVTGAGYPDALEPVVARFAGTPGILCDVGSGLGAAAVWVSRRSAARVVATEPEEHTAALARSHFPELSVVTATAERLPFGAAACAGVSLLGVVSLVKEIDVLLAEATRVLAVGGCLAIADLVAAGERTVTVDETGNVFRPVDALSQTLVTAGCSVDTVWTAPASIATAWDQTTVVVDREIGRRHSGSPAFADWHRDQQRLGELIEGGTLGLATIIATITPAR